MEKRRTTYVGTRRTLESAISWVFLAGYMLAAAMSLMSDGSWWMFPVELAVLFGFERFMVRWAMRRGMGVDTAARHACEPCEGRGRRHSIQQSTCLVCEGTGLKNAATRRWRNT